MLEVGTRDRHLYSCFGEVDTFTSWRLRSSCLVITTGLETWTTLAFRTNYYRDGLESSTVNPRHHDWSKAAIARDNVDYLWKGQAHNRSFGDVSKKAAAVSRDCDWTMVPRGFSHNKRLLTLWSFNLCWQRSFSLERSVCKVWTHVSENLDEEVKSSVSAW